MTLRVCLSTEIGFSSFLSRARIITFSSPRTRSKPPSLEAFYHFPGILTDFNSLPPASLVLLHFNCDFHGYLTRSRSTCLKCPSGINLKSAKNIEKHGETGENVEKQRNTGRIKKKHRKTWETREKRRKIRQTRDNVGKTGKCIET